MALRLTVPAGLADGGLPTETRPRQLKVWLDGLPLTQLFDSTKAVCDALASLNRSRLAADDRLRLLDVYQPTLQRLRAEVAEDYNKAPLPLPATSRQAVNLVRELLIEEAYGYKLALLEKSTRLLLFGVPRQLAPLIEQIMHTLSEALTLSYHSYLPTPAGVWRELHELYRYAAQQKLLDVESTEAAATPSASAIERIYKQAVLITLTDPYRLPRAELPEVMRIAALLAPLTEIGLGPPPCSQQLFVIHPDTDKPPKPVSQPGSEGAPPEGEWSVGTAPLVQRLADAAAVRQSGTRAPANDALQGVSLELLQRLIQCWGSPPKRVFRRQAGQAMVRIYSGINRICRLLGGGAATLGGLHQYPAAPADEPLHEWEVINQSAGGFKLRGAHAGDAAINVGEIIAVRHRGMPGFSIGAIRWVQSFDDGSVEFGVQMLAPRAEPASLEISIGSRGAQRALLLPEIATLQQPAAIVAHPGNHQPQREFLLAHAENLNTIRAGELLERTARYELFRILPG